MQAVSVYPGSCGELLQGRNNGVPMLISCPINLFTRVEVFETRRPVEKFRYPKSCRMLETLLTSWEYADLFSRLDLKITSDIPHSKGFASSTADLCGVYHALRSLCQRPFDQQELLQAAIRIEPTDSIIFERMTAIDYTSGATFETLGEYLCFSVLVFEGRKGVDTLTFNAAPLPPLHDITPVFQRFKTAVQQGNLPQIAAIAAHSIQANQPRLPYPILPEILQYCRNSGGLGVLGGHSGNMLGLIYDDPQAGRRALQRVPTFSGYTSYLVNTLAHPLEAVPF